jgi:hypothetical protein
MVQDLGTLGPVDSEPELETSEIAWEHLALLNRSQMLQLTGLMCRLVGVHAKYFIQQERFSIVTAIAQVSPSANGC